jgi:hypothetical protein
MHCLIMQEGLPSGHGFASVGSSEDVIYRYGRQLGRYIDKAGFCQDIVQ